MYLHLRVGVHSGTQNQYCSLQTSSCYSLYWVRPPERTLTLSFRFIQLTSLK
ncbi:unnamed protein product [Schistosoma curassoni]|uniref:Uncharacterized protein n=1 Tax=Schistosoma curassoni TaxID=6186 RepID=A0A183K0A2_9TREM|nr:unnamed protein product [Schistosoma curassoni]